MGLHNVRFNTVEYISLHYIKPYEYLPGSVLPQAELSLLKTIKIYKS
jgi:hypothetical protein